MTVATMRRADALDEEPVIPWGQVLRQLYVLVTVPLCFGFAVAKEDVLPDKYFADSHHIMGLDMAASGPSPDSFVTMAWLYRLVGAFDYPMATYLAALALFFVVMFRCIGWDDIRQFGMLEMLLFAFSGAEASIYLAQYSKESVIVLLALVLVMMPRRVHGDLVFVALACGYAYLIRQYWFIVVGLYLGLRVLLRSRRVRWLPIFLVVSMVALAFGVKLGMGVDLDSFRTGVNESNGLYAQSTIQDYIPVTGPLGGAANALLTLVLLVVPIPLILALSPTYLIFGGIISLLWLCLLQVARTGMRHGWFRAEVRLCRAVSLLLAMLAAQAIFEPDYGSYIKHLTPLLPLFFFALRARRTHRARSGTRTDPTQRPEHPRRHTHDVSHPSFVNLDDAGDPAGDPQTIKPDANARRRGHTAMTLSGTMRALLRKWYISVPGIALSCVLAGLTSTLIPAHYTSSGVAMVVQPKRPGALQSANPLLAFDTSLNTTAVMLSQSLNTPETAASLGLGAGPDKYTVKNVGDTGTGGDPNQPFIFVTAQGSTPQASIDIVQSVLSMAGQELADRQHSLHVSHQDSLSLATIAAASTPQRAPGLSLAAALGVLSLGIALTIVVCLARNRRIAPDRSHPPRARRPETDTLAALALEYGHTPLTGGPNNRASVMIQQEGAGGHDSRNGDRPSVQPAYGSAARAGAAHLGVRGEQRRPSLGGPFSAAGPGRDGAPRGHERLPAADAVRAAGGPGHELAAGGCAVVRGPTDA
jgi:hypothetical protein